MTDKTYILPIDRTQLATLRETAELALSRLQEHPCETPEQETLFSECAKHAHESLKKLEVERDELARPLLEQKREIDGVYKEVTGPLDRLKKLCKEKIGQAQVARLRAQQEALRLAEETAKAGKVEECAAALATIPELPVKQAHSSVKMEWAVKEWDLEKVPVRFLELREGEVKLYLRGLKEGEIPSVPGLVFEQRPSVRIR